MKKINKVLFTMDDYHVGGVTTFVQQYVNFLSGEFECHTLGHSGNLNPESFFSNITIHTIPSKIVFSIFSRLHSLCLYFVYLTNLQLKYKFDLVHLSITWSSLFVILNPFYWNTKKIITFYGAFHLEAGQNQNPLFFFLRKKAHHFVLSSSEKIITFSEYSARLITQEFSKKLDRKIVIIPGAIQDENIKNRYLYKKKENYFQLLNFGRAEKRKGLSLLVQAFAIVRNKLQKEAKLVLASPTYYFFHLKEIFKVYEQEQLFLDFQYVHKLNRKQRQLLIESSDLFVMPSIAFETFGMTIIECLSQGLPIVGFNSGAIAEILLKVDTNLVVAEKSALKLSKSIISFLKSSDLEKEKLSQKCVQTVKKHFSYSVVGKKYKKLVIEVTNEKNLNY